MIELKTIKSRPLIEIKYVLNIFLAFILIFTLCFNSAFASEILQRSQHWEFAGWFGGGFYPNTEFDPNIRNRVYLVSDVAGIWKSNDLGNNWAPINNGLGNLNVSFLEVAPSNSDILYAGTRMGLFRSKDQGGSWVSCDNHSGKISFKRPLNYRSLAISRENPNTLIAGTEKGEIYSSDDFGDSWENIKLPGTLSKIRAPIPVVQFDADETGLYAALDNEFYHYSLESRAWKPLRSSAEQITDFFTTEDEVPTICLAGGSFLLISDDGGESWRSSSKIPKGIAYRVVVFNFNQSRVIAVVWREGWQGGVYLSKDGGLSWEDSSDLKFDKNSNPTRIWANGGDMFVSLKVNPFDSTVLFITSAWGVFRSDNTGSSWVEKVKGAPNTVGSDIHITARGEIYVATMDNGLLKSTDSGRSYKTLFPKDRYKEDINGHVWRVATSPRDSKNVIITSSPWNVDYNQVVISKDAGKSFIAARDGLPNGRPNKNTMWEEGYPRALALDPNKPWLVYLGIDGDDGGGLFISHDAGWHWKYSKGQPGSRRIYNALAVDPTNSDRLIWGAYGEKGGIYVSQDRGESWEYVFNRMTKVFDLVVNPDGWIYAAGDFDGPAVFISKDNGKNWSLLKKFPGEGAAEALLIHPQDSRRIGVSAVKWYGDADGKIYESQDGGQSWLEITGDLPPGQGAAAMAFNIKDSSLYITRYAGSVYKTKW
ncbi:WD40/YVTN/BNR-like repeat-containing protein [Candidatus Omnitrophota bacterium]